MPLPSLRIIFTNTGTSLFKSVYMENYGKQNFFGLPHKAAYCLVISTWIISIYAIIGQQEIIREYQSIVDDSIRSTQALITPIRTLLKPEPPFDCMTISEYNYIFNSEDEGNR